MIEEARGTVDETHQMRKVFEYGRKGWGENGMSYNNSLLLHKWSA